ncbi:MAG: hypothetical protein ACRDEA_14295 [Microcystaceae cyanobacterium]
MKTFPHPYFALVFLLPIAWQSLGFSSAQASPSRLLSRFSHKILTEKSVSFLMAQHSSPSSLDLSSFFQTGRLRSQDRLLFQRPPTGVIPVRSQSHSWQCIIFREGGFSFWMPPGVLTEETVTLDTSLGQVSFRTLASNSDERRYVVAYADSLAEAQRKDPQVLLDAIKERVAPANQFELKQQQSITLENYPGRELTFENAEEVITMRVYLGNQKVYAMGVRYPKINALPRQTRAFLNAFELLGDS